MFNDVITNYGKDKHKLPFCRKGLPRMTAKDNIAVINKRCVSETYIWITSKAVSLSIFVRSTTVTDVEFSADFNPPVDQSADLC